MEGIPMATTFYTSAMLRLTVQLHLNIDICRLHSKLNHNGINQKETRVEQNSKKTMGMKYDIVIQRYMSR